MPATPAIAAIIAAYNEEVTIGAIVQTLVASKRFRDVIVVSDGSTDRTAEVAQACGASLVVHVPLRRGKGAALQTGVAKTDASYIVFLDGDLKGLTDAHLDALTRPVLDGSVAMNIGFIDHGPWVRKIMPYVMWISGQRAMRRSVFESVPDAYLQGFMVEEALNYACRIHAERVATIHLPGVTVRRKIQKVGLLMGILGYIRMSAQVWKAIILVRCAHLMGKFV